MNGYAPADLASRRSYIGLRHAAEFHPNDWLRERPSLSRLLPVPTLDHGSLGKRLCAFFADLETVLGQVWRVLKPGGHAVFVIANNVIKGQRIASHAILAELAKSIGFIEVKATPRTISSVRRRFPVGPFGFDGPMTHEYVVVLRKPRR
jgi:SAM-dependent methyltransferase